MKPMLSNLINGSITAYTLLAYTAGVYCLLQPLWWLNLAGVLLIIHALVFAAVLLHEFVHSTMFKSRSLNGFLGRLMAHLTGTWYVPYEVLLQRHLDHHVYHVDLIAIDFGAYLRSYPIWVQQGVAALEWAYIPAFDLLLRWRYWAEPFLNPQARDQRGRILRMGVYRGALFAGFGWLSLKALGWYAIAYLGFLAALRLVETFHHTYEYVLIGSQIPKRDRAYEDANTFSNIVSGQWGWLNLLYLNFGYHNAHHHDMRCPWYRLPELHHRLYGDRAKNLLPFPEMMRIYRRFRLTRLSSDQGEVVAEDGTFSLADFKGAVGVSLLTPP